MHATPTPAKPSPRHRHWQVAAQLALALVWAGSLGQSALAQTTVAGSTPGQFAVSQSGAANYRIPIQVPPGVSGMAPKLELVYSSQSGNGMLGMGWGISGLSAISRCPRTKAQDGVVGAGVYFDSNDRYCLDGQRLVLVSGTYGAAGSEYRTEIDTFSKIIAVGQAGNGPASFLVKTKGGLTLEYGNTSNARIEAIKAPGVSSAWASGSVRVWAQNKSTDVKGNYLSIDYDKDSSNGSYLPTRIDYGGNASSTPVLQPVARIEFIASPTARLDVASGYQAGASLGSTKRISALRSYNANTLVKEYRLAYNPQSSALDKSQLASITECDGTNNCLSPTQIVWGSGASNGYAASTSWIADYGVSAGGWTDNNSQARQLVDLNADGLLDVIGFAPNGVMVSINKGATLGPSSKWLDNQFGANTGWTYNSVYPRQVVDVDGDGLPDIVGFLNTGVQVALNKGDTFAPSSTWLANQFGFSSSDWTNNSVHPRQLVDVNGDGLPDIVGFGATGVMVAINTGSSFGAPSAWLASQYNTGTSWTNNNLHPRQLADVNGDGLPDIVGFGATGVMVALNTGSSFGAPSAWLASQYGTGSGWTDSNLHPRQLVDVNADGLPDIVGFGASGVMVSLNTGISFSAPTAWLASQYGTGSGWTDSNLHPRQLVDVNADGLADILGFGASGVMVSLNTGSSFGAHSAWLASQYGTGSGWTDSNLHPRQVADINGDGLPDLVGFGASGVMVALNKRASLGNYINTITAGIVKTSINYAALTSSAVYSKDSGVDTATYPQLDIIGPMYVVSSSTTTNPIGDTNTTNYSYGGLKAELGSGRGMLGFRWMRTKDIASGIENYSEHRQDWPYTGFAFKTEKRLSVGGLLQRSQHTVACKNPQTTAPCSVAPSNRYFVYVTQSAEQAWDINGAELPTVSNTVSHDVAAMDNELRGEPTQVQTTLSGGTSKTTVNEYHPANTQDWIVGRLKKATVTSVNASSSNSGGGTGGGTGGGGSASALSISVALSSDTPAGATTVVMKVTPTASGGVGPYTYRWERDGVGSLAMEVRSDGALILSGPTAQGANIAERFRVTVSDQRAVQYSLEVPLVATPGTFSSYSCPAGSTLSGSNCLTPIDAPATPVYACATGALVGDKCNTYTSSAASPVYGGGCPAIGAWGGSLDDRGTLCVITYPPGCEAPYVAISSFRQNGDWLYTCSYQKPVTSWACAAGSTLSGSTCSTVGSSVPATVTYRCTTGTVSGAVCVNGGVRTDPAISSYTCISGQVAWGKSCVGFVESVHYYSCPAGATLSGANCLTPIATPATPVYACATGTLVGDKCNTYTSFGASPVYGGGCPPVGAWGGSLDDRGTLCVITYPPGCEAPYVAISSFRQNGDWLYTCSYQKPITSWACAAGSTLSGSTCTKVASSVPASVTYRCTSGTVSGAMCLNGGVRTDPAIAEYTCGVGSTLSGVNCSTPITKPATPKYACTNGVLAGDHCDTYSSVGAQPNYYSGCPAVGWGGGSLEDRGSACVVTNSVGCVEPYSQISSFRQNGDWVYTCSYAKPVALWTCAPQYTLSGSSCKLVSKSEPAQVSYSCAQGTLVGAYCQIPKP